MKRTTLTLAAARELAKQHATFLPDRPTPADVADVEELIRRAIEVGADHVRVGYPHGLAVSTARNRVGWAATAPATTAHAWLSRLATIFTARGFTCKIPRSRYRCCKISGWDEEGE